MRILALANQKGGVGKTTTAINLSTALAAVGRRVLLVDLDPQGNASTGLGLPPQDRRASSYDLLNGDIHLEQARIATEVPGLDLIPSVVELAGLELELARDTQRAFHLRWAFDHFLDQVRQNKEQAYDYVFIDCPPSLNILTINAMAAAHAVLVPLQCEFFALEGLSQLMRTVDLVRAKLNPVLDVEGVALTMHDRRNNLSNQVAEDVRDHFGEKVYQTMIPRNVRVSEAPSFGKAALLYDYQCSGSQAYIQLAKELLHREDQRVVS